MGSRGLVLILCFFVAGLPGISPAAPSWQEAWSLTTDFKIESMLWPKAYGEGTNQTLNRLSLAPQATGNWGDSYRVVLAPNFQWDPQNKSSTEKIFFDIGDAYFRYKGDTTQWQIGSQILNWGVTDGYNPLDLVNPRQYYDPLHSVKLGVWSLLFSHATESAEQEILYIPKTQSTLLPGTNSRWLPRRIYIPRSIDNNIVLLLPENLHYSYTTHETLNAALDNNIGVRLQWHFGPVDIGLIGFDGVAAFPLVQPSVSGTVVQVSPKIILQTDSQVELSTKNYRQRVAGLTWVSSQWNFLLKYAGSYSQSLGDDPLLPGWSQENVLGLEKNFSLGNDGLLVAVLQYSFIRSQKENDSNLSVQEIFRRSWMAGGRLALGENWTLNIMALYDTLHYSHFEQYSVARRLYDTWTLQATAEVFSGQAETPLGVYSDNDNFRLSLSRSF